MISVYLGKKVSVKNIQLEIQAHWLVSSIFYDWKRVAILKIAAFEQQNWIGKSREILLQLNATSLNNIPNSTALPDE